jgi:hypothetical protein
MACSCRLPLVFCSRNRWPSLFGLPVPLVATKHFYRHGGSQHHDGRSRAPVRGTHRTSPRTRSQDGRRAPECGVGALGAEQTDSQHASAFKNRRYSVYAAFHARRPCLSQPAEARRATAARRCSTWKVSGEVMRVPGCCLLCNRVQLRLKTRNEAPSFRTQFVRQPARF